MIEYNKQKIDLSKKCDILTLEIKVFNINKM